MAEQYALLHQGQKYAGKSVADWTIEWWKWASDLPDGDNPFNDETGDLAIQGDIGPVVFLASTISTPENRHHLRRNEPSPSLKAMPSYSPS